MASEPKLVVEGATSFLWQTSGSEDL